MRVGIDVGGTFTDLVAIDGGTLRVVKVPSTPERAEAFLAALAAIPGEPEQVLHGTTVATNAVLERRGALLGFVSTAGFRHLLHLARQDRPSLYDMRARRRAPLVETDRCVGVHERIGPHGEVVTPLDEDGARVALASLRGVDAVCVALLHSYANPVHEERIGAIAQEVLPGVPVSLSSQVLREFREYERASTTALNAYVQPPVSRYLQALTPAPGVMWSSGGVRSVDDSVTTPVHLLLSGPAGGVLGAAWMAARAGFPEVVTLDMGGTSADVSIVEDGRPSQAEESSLDGLPFRTPCVDVVSVGAGGGSVAWMDEGGALRVGPRSAGALPGPACYGHGGDEPTVTDAHAVLGHVDALAGGTVPLDVDAARRAVARLGRDPEETARGILRVVRATMARAIRSVSVERGRDVRRYALVAFGGAGPLHGVELARELGMSRVVIPQAPGALAAFGLLVARPRAERSVTRPVRLEDRPDGELDELLDGLEIQVRSELRATAVTERAVDCRYVGQSYEIRIPVRGGIAELRSDFDAAHAQRFGFARTTAPVEAVTFRAVALGPAPEPDLRRLERTGKGVTGGRRVVEGRPVPVYSRAELPAGARIDGPAIVGDPDATTWLPPGSAADVAEDGSLVVHP